MLTLQIGNTQSCDNGLLLHYSFEDISKILDKSGCNSCHKSGQSTSWNYQEYFSLFEKNNCNQSIIVRGNAGASTIISTIKTAKDCSNDDLAPLHLMSTPDIKAIESWINIGAPKNCIPLLNDIIDISKDNGCFNCHNLSNQEGGWYLDDKFDSSIGSNITCKDDLVVTLYRPENSTFFSVIQQANDCNISDPQSHKKLKEEEIILINDWISAGAPISSQSLPLELVSFDLFVKNAHPLLLWETSSELGVEKFVIERSNSGHNFEAIADVQARGAATNSYSYENVSVSYGNYYYRIKIMDFDGRHEYSPIEYISINAKTFIFDIYPNPILNHKEVILEWYSKNDIQLSAKLKLMDSSGKVLHEQKIQKGTNRINTESLSRGVYYLTIADYYGGTHFERLVVMNE